MNFFQVLKYFSKIYKVKNIIFKNNIILKKKINFHTFVSPPTTFKLKSLAGMYFCICV